MVDKTVEINEIVTFIKATREEALALAYDIGGGEVHALHIQGGFGMPAEKPVGYLVLPLKREWVGLDGEIPGLGLVTEEFYNGMIFAEDILRERNGG